MRQRWTKRLIEAVSVLKRVAQDRRGVTSVEYALIALLVAVAAYGGVSQYGSKLGVAWNHIGTAIPN